MPIDFSKIVDNYKGGVAVQEPAVRESRFIASSQPAPALPQPEKSWGDVLGHGISRAGLNTKFQFLGGLRLIGDLADKSDIGFFDHKGKELLEVVQKVGKGLDDYVRAHPEEVIHFTPVEGGILDKFIGYSKQLTPKKVAQGAIETVPLLLEAFIGQLAFGGLGLAKYGPKGLRAARGLGMALPIFGQTYEDARRQGEPVELAFPKSLLTSGIEAAIEEWTLGAKINLFKKVSPAFKRGWAGGAANLMLGTAKAYGRGSLEEFSQEINRNLWNRIFSKSEVRLLEGAAEAAAVGGPIEAVLSGAFRGAGLMRRQTDTRPRKLSVVENMRTAFQSEPSLNELQKTEINAYLDDVAKQVATGEYDEAMDPEMLLEEALQVPEKPTEAPTTAEKAPVAAQEAITPEIPPKLPSITKEAVDLVEAEDLPSNSPKAYAPGRSPEIDARAIRRSVMSRYKKPDAQAQAMSQRLLKDIDKLKGPEKDFMVDTINAIEKWRGEVNIAGINTEWAKERFYEVAKNRNQLAAVANWLDNPNRFQEAYSKLPANAQKLGTMLKADFDAMKKIAQSMGMLQEWKEAYLPHIYSDNEKRLKAVLYPIGGKLGTRLKFARKRMIPTIEQAKQAPYNLHPIEDPVLLNAVYKYQLYRVVAARNLIQTFRALKLPNGMPLITTRPRNPQKRRVWDEQYKWVNHPALAKFMYVGEAEGKPMLVKGHSKAHPDVARVLNDVFNVSQLVRGKTFGRYLWLRGKIKRLIMMNPAIHGINILSDVLDEVNFNPYQVTKVFRRGGQLYKAQDPIVLYAAESGLELQTAYSVASDLRKALLEAAGKHKGIFAPLTKLEQFSDKFLWQKIVRNAQIGLFEYLTTKIQRAHPDWSKQKVGRLAATHINTLLGTIPHTWMRRWAREAGSIGLFARNWTLSNIDLVVRALGKAGPGGLFTRPIKILDTAQRTELARLNAKHLAKGIIGLFVFANLLQYAFLKITNDLKKKKILDVRKHGPIKPIRSTLQNEQFRNVLDVDTGWQSRGQTIYLVPPLFRYIRDYFGWMTEADKTAYNKMEPLLKQFIEQLWNYSRWQRKEIATPGATTWEQTLQRAKYFVHGITPAQFYAHKPGRPKTQIEWLAPYLGMWARRGAPGGKYTGLLWKYRNEKRFKQSKTDNKINEMLTRGEFPEAIALMVQTGRYTSSAGVKLRLLRALAPLNYYWRTASKREKIEYLAWLRKNGASRKQLMVALRKELETLAKRPD